MAGLRSSSAIPWDRLQLRGEQPRHLSLALVVQMLLGGGLPALGLMIASFLSVFIWLYEVPGALADVVMRPADLVRVQVDVEASRRTALKENKKTIFEHTIRYRAADGERRGRAFSTTPVAVGSTAGSASPSGDWIEVDGMSRHPADLASAAAISLFFMAGIGAVLGQLVRGARALQLLRRGVPARASIVRREVLHAPKARGTALMRYVFAFTPAGARSPVEISVKAPAGSPVTDENEELVLYDRAHPPRAVVLGALPGDPRLQDNGSFAAARWPILPLLLLGLFVAVNFFFALRGG